MGKRVLIASLVALLFPLMACGQTQVTANILSSTTWTVGGSPYVVHGTIRVRNGSTLSIDPGVVVRFKSGQPRAQLETDAGSSIVAVGTAADSVVFTSDPVTPAAGDWGSVMVFASTGSRGRRPSAWSTPTWPRPRGTSRPGTAHSRSVLSR